MGLDLRRKIWPRMDATKNDKVLSRRQTRNPIGFRDVLKARPEGLIHLDKTSQHQPDTVRKGCNGLGENLHVHLLVMPMTLAGKARCKRNST